MDFVKDQLTEQVTALRGLWKNKRQASISPGADMWLDATMINWLRAANFALRSHRCPALSDS